MKSFTSTATILASILASVRTAAGFVTERGCYSSVEPPLENFGVLVFASHGTCREVCTKEKKMLVMALGGDTCYCGDMLPSEDNRVDDELCDVKCSGYPLEICGGSDAFSVFLTGVSGKIPTYDGEDEEASTSPSLTSSSEDESQSTTTPSEEEETATETHSSSSKSGSESTATLEEGETATVTPTMTPTVTSTVTPTGETPGEETGGGSNMAGRLSPQKLILAVWGLLPLFYFL